MSSGGLRAASPIPTGNAFDKYGSSHVVVRRLMAGFQAALGELIEQARPTSILDVGCGEGVLTQRWAQRLPAGRVVGLDLDDPRLAAEWSARRRENLQFITGEAAELPFAAGEFDLVAAIETLEHVGEPRRALEEMARVAARHLLVSVPREPLWRMLNLVRGAYVGRLGNTPGHVNHWSRSGLARLLTEHGELVELRTPFPWTMALVRVS